MMCKLTNSHTMFITNARKAVRRVYSYWV